MFSKSLTKHLKGFGGGFTELHAKFDADTLLDFAIHHGNKEQEVQKALVKKQCLFTARCHVADRCNRLAEVWPWPPLLSSFTEAVATITVREHSDTTCVICVFSSTAG
jgi:hypothetical protein